MVRSKIMLLLPAGLMLSGCNAVDSFNAVGEGVEQEMAKQQAEAEAAMEAEKAEKAKSGEAKDSATDQAAPTH